MWVKRKQNHVLQVLIYDDVRINHMLVNTEGTVVVCPCTFKSMLDLDFVTANSYN